MKRKNLFGIAALAAIGILLAACPTGGGGGGGGGGGPVTTTTVFRNADTELTITQTTAKSARALANGSGTYVLKKGSPLVTISEGAVTVSGGGVTLKFTPSTKGQQSFSVTITAGEMADFTIPVSGGAPITISGLTEASGGGGSGVYVAGSYLDSSGADNACYWKNGTRTNLAVPGYYSYAYSIAVSGNDVYVAGYYWDSSYTTETACYWKNGTKIDLPVPAAPGGSHVHSEAKSIAVSGSDVYVAGEYSVNLLPPATGTGTDTAYYWINGTRTELAVPGGITRSYARSIAVSGSDVYVAGYYYDSSTSTETACYWINGTRIELPGTPGDDNSASAIAVSGSDVHVVGYSYGTCYWKNGVRTELSSSGGNVNDIVVVE
jgi:hypothetical protein